MLWENLTVIQRRLLAHACRHTLVFSGEETDEERLSMLQLYTLGLVKHARSWRTRGAMEWHATQSGRAMLEAWKAQTGSF